MKKYLIILLLLVFAFPSISSAQKVGLKTNALYWATTTPNLGVEVAMGEKFTFNLEGGYNPWTFNEDLDVNQKMKHFIVSPEVRYWFCESFNGHFVGLMANCSQFNVSAMPIPNVFMTTGSKGAVVEGSKESRYQGWAAGAGLTYGYQLILGKHWNMEATLGLGYWYATYDQYENRKCGYFTQACQKHLFGPTKLGLTFIYLFK